MITLAALLLAVAGAYCAFWASYVLLLPVLAGLRGAARPRDSRAQEPRPTMAVIVPAHDMALVIARCIESLRACDYPQDHVQIFVAADHCTDDTAEQARGAGAAVLVRDDGPPGKTYALAWTLDRLAELHITPDLYLIVDATVRVDSRFLEVMATRAGEDIVIGHPIVDPDNRQWFARCIGLTLAHRNLQNQSRERLGLSALIGGRGMAYRRRYIEKHGWRLALPTAADAGSHPTEDWRHGVRAVEHGYRVAFAADALLYTPLRGSLRAATKQGVRWERGRMANVGTHALRVLLAGARQGNLVKVVAGLDATQLPVAILGGLCVAVALSALVAFGTGLAATLAFVPLALICLYAVAVAAQGRREGIEIRTILWAPVYIAWRCAAFVIAWASLDRLFPAARRQRKDTGTAAPR